MEDIIELNYYGHFKVTLFKCNWANTIRDMGFRKDSWGFTCINFSRLIHIGDHEEHDPYIEDSQAEMVYYVNDEVNKDWIVLFHLKPRYMMTWEKKILNLLKLNRVHNKT